MISLLFPHLPSTPHHSSEVVIIYPDPCMTVGAGISGCSTVFGSSAVENGFLDKRKNTRGRFHRKEVSHLRIYIYVFVCIYIYTSNIIHLHVHSYSPKSIGKMTSPEFPFPTGKAPKLPFKNLSGGRYMISME